MISMSAIRTTNFTKLKVVSPHHGCFELMVRNALPSYMDFGLISFLDPRVLQLPAFLGRHGTIRGMILELRHISVKHRTTDTDEAANIEAAISRWWNEAQDLLEPHYVEHDDNPVAINPQNNPLPLKASHKLLLIVQKHESTILLNRPVISSANTSALYTAAMQKCIGASKQIVSKVYQHLYNGMTEVNSRDGKIRNPLFWPGFTWCVWMRCVVNVFPLAALILNIVFQWFDIIICS